MENCYEISKICFNFVSLVEIFVPSFESFVSNRFKDFLYFSKMKISETP